jgi:hypothetical protein
MQYALLIYSDPATDPVPGTPAFDTMMQGYFGLSERMKDRATVKAGEALERVHAATSVRVRGGRVETTDGPFAETREHLGGFYVIEAADLDAALAFAAAIPTAAHGTVEVRPVMTFG